MAQPPAYVYNRTDGVPAWPGLLPINKAKEFVRDFPKRYEPQGYYLTAAGDRIRPEDVKLVLLDDHWEPVRG